MSAETLPFIAPDVSPSVDLQRLYRRICVLRAGGKMTEAAELEHSELNPALDLARARGESARIAALFAAEDARVGEARLLAELLAPMLARSLNLTLTSASNVAAPTDRRRRPLAESKPSGAAPTVTDFIDGMLSQEPR